MVNRSPMWPTFPDPELARRNLIEEALRRQPDEGGISIDDALTFVSDLFCRASRPVTSGKNRSSSRCSSARSGRGSGNRTPRLRNSRTPSAQGVRGTGNEQTVPIETGGM
jgi:hypothetical protein